MTAKDVLKELKDYGWEVILIRGSHVQLKHPTLPGKVTVPMHSGDIPPGTLNSIRKQAGLKESDRRNKK